MIKNKSSSNLTRKHFFDTAQSTLSSRILKKYSMTDLERQSEKSRSVLYYHFSCMEDFYFDFFEEKIVAEVAKDCHNYQELVISAVDYILENKYLCLNIYRLSKIMDHPDYLLDLCTMAFNEYEIPHHKLKSQQAHLMGGIVYTLRTWLESDLRTSRDEVINRLLEHCDLLKSHQK